MISTLSLLTGMARGKSLQAVYSKQVCAEHKKKKKKGKALYLMQDQVKARQSVRLLGKQEDRIGGVNGGKTKARRAAGVAFP